MQDNIGYLFYYIGVHSFFPSIVRLKDTQKCKPIFTIINAATLGFSPGKLLVLHESSPLCSFLNVLLVAFSSELSFRHTPTHCNIYLSFPLLNDCHCCFYSSDLCPGTISLSAGKYIWWGYLTSGQKAMFYCN